MNKECGLLGSVRDDEFQVILIILARSRIFAVFCTEIASHE